MLVSVGGDRHVNEIPSFRTSGNGSITAPGTVNEKVMTILSVNISYVIYHRGLCEC